LGFWVLGFKKENVKMGATALLPSNNTKINATVGSKEDEESEWVVCMESNCEFAVVPCGLLCLCHVCQSLSTINTCPICRGAKDSVLKIHSL